MRSVVLIAWVAASGAYGADSGSDVQRLIQQREQSQTELRLRMQQQQGRALSPPGSPAADFQLRQIERDQQQRLREAHELENREREAREIAPTDATRALRATEGAGR